MTLEPRILNLWNPSNNDVATRVLINKMFFNKKNHALAAQVAMLPYMDWFETSLSAKCEIPQPLNFAPNSDSGDGLSVDLAIKL